MNKLKLFIGFSAIISLLMCALTSSYSFLFSDHIMYEGTMPDMINEIVNEAFNYNYVTLINVILAVIFLLNTISLILYLFKTDKRAKMMKYFSLSSTLLLIIGIALFALHVNAYIRYYDIIDMYGQFSLKFKIFRWIPRILIFSIPTIYLLGTQIYIINKVKSVRIDKKLIIMSVYSSFILFITAITFCEFSFFIDYLVYDLLRVRTHALIAGDLIYGKPYANVDYYLNYVIFLTVVFGAIMLFSRKRSKKQIK